MSWTKRESASNLVVLGDEKGHRRKVGGLLAACHADRTYPEKQNYVLIQQDGEELVVSGSANLARQLNEQDIGKFVKCEFTGWGRSGNGKFKIIEVNVWEGEPNDVMRKWPRYAELTSPGRVPTRVAGISASDNHNDKIADDGFDGFEQPTFEDDDLPFNFGIAA